jgi:hypothetical protein
MISCQLLQTTRSANGLPTCSEIRIAAESLHIGRGAGCQIHLPDHRVSLLHAIIRRNPDGSLAITSEAEQLLSVDGFMAYAATLVPGMKIRLGPYLLTVELAVDDVDITLSLAMPKKEAAAITRTSHTRPGFSLSKRLFGLGLAAVVLVGWFLLPLMARVSPVFEDWLTRGPMPLTQALSPGPLSGGHQIFGMKCSHCHQQAFHGVSDDACTQCHQSLASHLDSEFAHLATTPASISCVECHPAHDGKAHATRDTMAQCVACHRQLTTPTAEAKDFARQHPAFELAIPTGKTLTHMRQGSPAMPAENAGLKFSHAIHLDKEGVSSPEGQTKLHCTNCHRPDAAGERFLPTDMEKTCQQSSCHKTRYEEPGRGFVPHGSVREAVSRLRNAYTAAIADMPGQYASQCTTIGKLKSNVRNTLDCAEKLAHAHAARTLFRSTGENLECTLCHEISETGKKDTPWKVTHVSITHDWMPKAVFSHARHSTAECVDCHDKVGSKTSADVSMPDIETCRKCHTGANHTIGKVISSCESCHRFHRVGKTSVP